MTTTRTTTTPDSPTTPPAQNPAQRRGEGAEDEAAESDLREIGDDGGGEAREVELPRPDELGDSLFPGGVGATFGDADAFAQLIDEVETKIFGTLPDDTWVYPGHGKDTTLGAERPHLGEWRERGW